jgi:hypothetical protein
VGLAAAVALFDCGVNNPPHCAALSACCHSSSFPQAAQPACNQLVNSGTDQQCAQALSSYQSGGVCSAAGQSQCAALSACCHSSTFPQSAQPACDQLVSTGTDLQCSQALASYENANLCSGLSILDLSTAGSGCGRLSACCNSPTFPASAQQQCLTAAQSGIASSCDSAFAQLQQAGYCSGSTSGGTTSGVRVPDLAQPMLGCRGHLQCLQMAQTAADQANCDAMETVQGQMLDQAWNDCLTTACLMTKDTDFGSPDCDNQDFANCTTNAQCNPTGCGCDMTGMNCSICTCTQGACTTRDVCSNCISKSSATGGACFAQAQACLNDRP